MFYEDIDFDTEEEYTTYLKKDVEFNISQWHFRFEAGEKIRAIWQHGHIWHISPTNGTVWVEVDSSYLALT